jgi:hypothetical protein
MEFDLMDNAKRKIGKAFASFGNDCYMVGSFLPSRYFYLYTDLFKEHEKLVNEQCFLAADRIEKKIESYGFYIIGPLPRLDRYEIECLQIMKKCISFACKRLRERIPHDSNLL